VFQCVLYPHEPTHDEGVEVPAVQPDRELGAAAPSTPAPHHNLPRVPGSQVHQAEVSGQARTLRLGPQ